MNSKTAKEKENIVSSELFLTIEAEAEEYKNGFISEIQFRENIIEAISSAKQEYENKDNLSRARLQKLEEEKNDLFLKNQECEEKIKELGFHYNNSLKNLKVFLKTKDNEFKKLQQQNTELNNKIFWLSEEKQRADEVINKLKEKLKNCVLPKDILKYEEDIRKQTVKEIFGEIEKNASKGYGVGKQNYGKYLYLGTKPDTRYNKIKTRFK